MLETSQELHFYFSLLCLCIVPTVLYLIIDHLKSGNSKIIAMLVSFFLLIFAGLYFAESTSIRYYQKVVNSYHIYSECSINYAQESDPVMKERHRAYKPLYKSFYNPKPENKRYICRNISLSEYPMTLRFKQQEVVFVGNSVYLPGDLVINSDNPSDSLAITLFYSNSNTFLYSKYKSIIYGSLIRIEPGLYLVQERG